MFNLYAGIAILIFGLTIGGAGIASAGIGIGIPMIPLGIYLSYKGWRIYRHAKASDNPQPLEPFEKTKMGKAGLGILLLLVGIGTSAIMIGIPIMIAGFWLLYSAFKKEALQSIFFFKSKFNKR